MSLKGIKWGYCSHCSKEIPIVATDDGGRLEDHKVDGNFRDGYTTTLDCLGSWTTPGVSPVEDKAKAFEERSSLPSVVPQVGLTNVTVNGVDITDCVSSVEIDGEVLDQSVDFADVVSSVEIDSEQSVESTFRRAHIGLIRGIADSAREASSRVTAVANLYANYRRSVAGQRANYVILDEAISEPLQQMVALADERCRVAAIDAAIDITPQGGRDELIRMGFDPRLPIKIDTYVREELDGLSLRALSRSDSLGVKFEQEISGQVVTRDATRFCSIWHLHINADNSIRRIEVQSHDSSGGYTRYADTDS